MDETIQIVARSETGLEEPEFPGSTSSAKTRQKKPKRMSAVIAFSALTIITAASIVGSYGWRNTLGVRRVFVEGNRSVTAADIVALTKVKTGAPLYGINLDLIQSRILAQHFIKFVGIVRELPDAVRITVHEREPVAAFLKPRMMLVDDEGVVLKPNEGSLVDVPFIRGIESAQVLVGEQLTDLQFLRALELLKQARSIGDKGNEIYHLISEVSIEPNGDIVLYSSDAGVKILLGKQNEIKKLLMLKTFWDQFVQQRRADQLQLVDLRFDDQVVARWSSDRQ
jgi:cell division septal protein FtsQ